MTDTGDDEDARRLGRLIQIRRKDIGLTQKQFAAKMDVGYRTAGAWERGEVTIKPRDLRRIQVLLRARIERSGSGEWTLTPGRSHTDTAQTPSPSGDHRYTVTLPAGALDGLSDLDVLEVRARIDAEALRAVREIRSQNGLEKR